MKTAAKTTIIDALGMGIGIWLIGYIGSILLFSFIPANLLGWILFTVLTPLTLLIAYLRFRNRSGRMRYYLLVAAVWVCVAVVFDYLFIVKLFNSIDYYKPDVFVYYITTFIIPLAIGHRFGRSRK
ncbi:MAG: hypothetical protein KGH59_01465 [Candidatus Micrarchaeota archaeon]|nr:hypothetical protein [Candidatus Micrarchaeota archaeon]